MRLTQVHKEYIFKAWEHQLRLSSATLITIIIINIAVYIIVVHRHPNYDLDYSICHCYS